MNYLRKELYQLIKTDESIFDFIQESSLDGLWYWDLENMEEEWMNPKFWTTLGYDPAEMPHKAAAWQDIIHPEDLELAKENVGKHLANPNYPYDQVVRYQHKQGHTVWIRCRGLAVRDKLGKPVRMLGAHTDITAEKRKEQLLTETNRVARVGAWEVDFVNNTMFWSDVTKEIHEVPLDYQPNLETGINFYKEGKSREIITHCVNEAMENGTPWDVELQIVTAKQKEIWVRAIGDADFQNGVCRRIYGVFQDINEKKLASQQLRQSEELFRQTFDHAVIGMTLVDKNGKWIQVNDSFCQLVGYTRKELLNKMGFQDLSHPSNVKESTKELMELARGERDVYIKEKRYIHKNGHDIWLVIGVSRVLNAEGKILHYVAQYSDITKRKKAELKLKKEQTFLQTLIDNLPVNVYVKDLASRKILANKKELAYMGVSDISAVLGKAETDFYPAGTAIISREEDLHVFNTGQAIIDKETTNIRKDGSISWFLTSKIPLKDDAGKIDSLLGISYNISKFKEAEEKLRKLSILEAKSKEMEQFAYIASHDLREPLTTIKGYLALLKEEFLEQMPKDAQDILQFTIERTNRMDKLIHGLLDYSRLSQVKELASIDCNEIMQEVLADLSASIQQNAVQFELPSLPTLQAHPLELKQLFQNIISNAIKFRRPNILPKISIQCKPIPKGWQFQISDNGIGIEQSQKDRIFYIFQRLHREEYEGTGIGLANCKKIVELHNGEIWVESKLGEGSTFHFTINTEEKQNN